MVLGLVVSMLTFTGALNVERASQAEGLTEGQHVNLQIWSSIYFLVSWACLNHALNMLFPDMDVAASPHGLVGRSGGGRGVVKKKCVVVRAVRTCCSRICSRRRRGQREEKSSESSESTATTIIEQPPPVLTSSSSSTSSPTSSSRSTLRSVRFLSTGFKFVRSELVSTRGTYFMFTLFAKELLESVLQMSGIINTADQINAEFLCTVGLLVAMNLVILNVVNLFLRRWFGHIVATGAVVLIESLFDKTFLVLSVFVRDTQVICQVDLPFWEQLLRHGMFIFFFQIIKKNSMIHAQSFYLSPLFTVLLLLLLLLLTFQV
jgi:hypothetical protein